MRKIIKKVLPDNIKKILLNLIKRLELIRVTINDYNRFRKYSFGINEPKSKKQLCALITKNYHSIEKGLSYQKIRLGFGKDVVSKLIGLLEKYQLCEYSLEEPCVGTAISTLYEYVKYHEVNSYNVSELRARLMNISKNYKNGLGGVQEIKQMDIMERINGDFELLANSRHSVREFADKDVDINLIEEAIDIAKKTPSACNRQAWRVKIIKSAREKEVILKNQNGNKGFGDQINTFALVTCDINSFSAPRERNQVYIDGGMFAMSLLYALHYKGLAACSLSASLTKNQEKRIRKSLSIEESDELILFIGVGHYVNEFKVPKSNRKDAKRYYEVI